MALLLGTAGGVRWLLFHEAGSRWLLESLPAVQVSGFRGALLGDHWQADRVQVTWAGGEASLTLEDLRADGLAWHWRPHPQAWLGVDMAQFVARRVTVVTGPPTASPLPVPLSIAWPVQVVVASARAEELIVDDLPPLRRLALQQLVLDAQPGAEHRVARASVDWQGATFSASARIGNQAPLPLALDGTVVPTDGGDIPAWAAVLRASGTAALFDLEATLRGVPRGPHAAPTLDLRAKLQLLQAWPLAGLTLQTTALDLAALSTHAPQTRLSGNAELASTARNEPLRATVDLRNALPGRWNEGRLPVRSVMLQALGTLEQPDRLEITRFDVELADATRSAGRWSGSALWLGTELTLNTRLAAVAPQWLDSRAAAMTLTGPVSAKVRGLPSPDTRAAADTGAPTQRPQVDWTLDLTGMVEGAPKAVRLAMQGSASDQRVELRRVRAEAGAASAELRATLQRTGPQTWELQTAGNLVDFNPVPWWPGEVGSGWRQGPHRLSAQWDLNLRLPANAAGLPWPALAQRLAGNGSLRIQDSVLAGVPLAASMDLKALPAAGQGSASMHAELLLGGNRFTVDGRGDPGGSGQTDHWRAELAAGSLVSLAPLVRLSPALVDWLPQRGSADATLVADGRWPDMRLEGHARVQQLLAGPLALADGQARWHMDTGGAQPLSLQVDLADLKWGAAQAGQVRASLDGRLADHRIEFFGALPLAPPLLAERALGLPAQPGTRAQLLARGAWLANPAGGGVWSARVERLQVGTWDGTAKGSEVAPWAETRDLNVEATLGAGGSLLALRADPGRLRLGDAVALRWDEVRVDLRSALPQIELHADIEPFAVAPLLARMQPGAGWQGDLKMGGRVDIRAAERFDADLVFERSEGDLHLADAGGMQLMGLSELRLALSAHNGLWTFTPTLKGRSLGEIGGQLQVRTGPERRWPHADAAIGGSAQAFVADLGIWSAWVPPGWRLAGELRSTATLGGTFGDPRFTGALSGSRLSVRNLLQGVNVADGEVAVRLEGDTAQIDRFTLNGGDGRITVTGGATLGRAPQARLKLVAERFRVLGRVDRLVIASGQAELSLQAEQARLDGRFTVDEGLFDISRADAPTLDNDVTVRREGGAEPRAAEAAAPRPARNFVLGLDIDMGPQLKLRGRGLDTLLRGQLRLTAPAGRLAINGTISTEGGTYAAYGQRLVIDRGIVAFSGPPDNPRLDVLALRPNIDLRVGVAITGNVQTPRVRLFSDPEMSENEKLSWLLLGREPDGLDRADTALLQRAAVALLAGEGEAPTDALLRNLGIDELSLRQGDTNGETVIMLGKQLSRNWFVSYERGVNATIGTWQLTYRIAQRITVRAQSGEDNSLDVIWVWRLQETPADAGMRKSTVVPP
ncbi:MAG: translocation/assembly module TamB domain-containing protein [Rubrivivax sp.]|nr:translocation/assembly module TamB domain-containing protein [Rubrivivax sp.]